MEDKEYGSVKININDYLEKHNISKNFLEEKANLSRTQLNKYCNNKIQRVDMAVVSRICFALNCALQDIVVYIPPKK